MIETLTVRAALDGISGIFLVYLGGWILALRSKRPGGVRLALLTLVWGLQVTFVQAINLVDSPWSERFFIFATAFLLLLPTLIVYFVASQSPRLWKIPNEVAIPTFVGVALTGGVSILLQGIPSHAPGANAFAVIGDVPLLFGAVPLYAALCLAALTFLSRLEAAGSPLPARQAALLGAGLVMYLSYVIPWYGIWFLENLPEYSPAAGPLATAAQFAIYSGGFATLLAAAKAVHAPRSRLRGADRRILVAALYVPLAFGVADGIAAALHAQPVNTLGLWRILLVGLVAFAVLRHQLLDAPTARVSGFKLTFGAFFGVALVLIFEQVVRRVGETTALAIPGLAAVAGALFVGGLLVPFSKPAGRAARWAFLSLASSDDPSPAERVEVYRAEIQERRARGKGISPSDPGLVELRRRLDLDERDHDIIALFIERGRGTAAAAPRLQPGAPILDGAYHVEEEVGRGAISTVYRCRDPMGRVAAVKILPPLISQDALTGARYVREAEILRRIRSPHVIRIIEVADRDDGFFIVTEYAGGGTLADSLRRAPGGRLPIETAVRITREVLEGLVEAHLCGVLHLDVKPENVLLTEEGAAKLADFDAAIGLMSAPTLTRRTTALPSRGTPPWMSPEQLRGDPVGPPADVYAVGVLLHRMIFGEHYLPLEGLSLDHLRRVVVEVSPVVPPGLPPPVAALLTHALRKAPKDRPQDARAALALLGGTPHAEGR